MKTPIVAITGGKGGTGKSTISVNLAVKLTENLKVLLVDADVDNPNDSTLLGCEVHKIKDLKLFAPNIDPIKCIKCGSCVKICPEHALIMKPNNPPFLLIDRCSGCMACKIICPANAISNKGKILGELFKAEINNLTLIGAKLVIGEARSPLVVKGLIDHVLNIIEKNHYDIVLIDTAPGIQNTVIQALIRANHAFVVTEPTPLGLYTLKLITDALNKLNLPRSIIINRSDIPSTIKNELISFAIQNKFKEYFEVPYDEKFIIASVKNNPIIKLYPESKGAKAITKIADYIKTAFIK